MKYYFIVNKASKTGKAQIMWNELENELKLREVEYEAYFTEGPGHATALADMICSKEGKINLCVCGGDGTLNEALNGMKDFDRVDLCYFPLGSANDFARGVGLKGSPVEILDRVLKEEKAKSIDIGEVIYDGGSKRFAVSAGVGVDAYVCLQALTSKLKKFLNFFRMGQLTYGLLTIGDIFTMPTYDAVAVADGKEVNFKKLIFACAMNCPYEGGGIPMVPYAKPTSGHLSTLAAHDMSRIKCLTMLPSLISGAHVNTNGGFSFIDFERMEVTIAHPMCVHADGEHCGFHDHITFVCHRNFLRIRGL